MNSHVSQSHQRINLSSNWIFRQAGTPEWYPATVPGCNFTDLFANQLIVDPMYGDNEARLQWIEKEDWEYKTEFFLTQDQLDNNHLRLIAEGLDTFCTIYINGSRVADSKNMFVPVALECKNYLKAGANQLVLYFHSPINRVKPEQINSGIVYPAENDKSSDKLSVFVRKAPCHFGWDWGPRFVTSGIWRPIFIDLTPVARIDDIQFYQEQLTDDEVIFSLKLSGYSCKKAQYHLQIHSEQDSGLAFQQLLDLDDGYWEQQVFYRLKNPKRWWPNGLGEAFLYKLTAALYQNNQIVDEKSLSIGFRTLEVISEADQDGQCFYIKVNGLPVFMKGANYIPTSAFIAGVTREILQKELSSVKQANMNMLRVWGGGVYQSDEFYTLADEMGILIWQDFMFACSLYPASTEFIENVSEEAQSNILRLRNHPCIALWCGNNEVDMAITYWDWPKKFGYSEQKFSELKADYRRLFDECLPKAVSRLDPSRFYMRSSPIGFWEDNKDHIGNQHYWGVWHGEEPFTEYQRRIPRFMTEFGFQSFPLLSSVEKFLPQQEHYIDSPLLTVHQKHPRGNKLIQQYMVPEYSPPKNFESLLYLSQIQQAMGLKMAFEAHRQAMPFCMGTLYWQLNDTWPAASWSSIDYYGKWKALHYQAARCFKPQAVVFSQGQDGLVLSLVSDAASPLSVMVELMLLDFSGKLYWSTSQSVVIPAQTSQSIFEQLEQQFSVQATEQFLYARVFDSATGSELADNTYYFSPCKALKLPVASPSITLDLSEECLSVTLLSTQLLRFVYIDLPNVTENFSDNFFDLLPNCPKTIVIELKGYSHAALMALSQDIKCMSVIDTY